LFIATSKERTEPIAGRIIEVPERDQSELLRNSRSGFVAITAYLASRPIPTVPADDELLVARR
jgi:hypothetical protein